MTAGERENNRHINKSIFPAFREIERSCFAEQFPHETVRCERALALMKSCAGDGEHACDAQKYYDALFKTGFDLPPFYEPGYWPK